MKITACLLGLALASSVFAFEDSVKQDAKDAGNSTKKAAKTAAKKTKKGTKKVVNKSADKVGEGADKVKAKTNP